MIVEEAEGYCPIQQEQATIMVRRTPMRALKARGTQDKIALDSCEYDEMHGCPHTVYGNPPCPIVLAKQRG